MQRSSAAFLVSLAVLSAASIAHGQAYVEGVNEDEPIDDGWTATGGHEQAFRWTAQNTFDLTQVEFHCAAINTMVIRLREDTGGAPGAILREITFNAPSLGWNGAVFSTPYTVTAGQSYFVTMASATHDYTDFIAETGVILTYYWTINGQKNWNGPFSGAPGRRKIKFYEPKGGPACLGDLDDDGAVGAADLATLLGSWGPVPPGDPNADLDGNGDIGAADLAILLGNWGPCD